MQIEFVQSSIKTGCLSSLPPVRTHSPSAALKSRVEKFGLRRLNDNEYDVTGGVGVHIEGTELHQLN